MAIQIPLWEKTNLTLEEASAYCGIGINKLREMSNDDNCSLERKQTSNKAKETGRIPCESVFDLTKSCIDIWSKIWYDLLVIREQRHLG